MVWLLQLGLTTQVNFVQLGPGLKSEIKALDQSRTLNSLWTTHHPPTENFSKGSRLRKGPRLIKSLTQAEQN